MQISGKLDEKSEATMGFLSSLNPTVKLFYRMVGMLRSRTVDTVESIAAWSKSAEKSTGHSRAFVWEVRPRLISLPLPLPLPPPPPPPTDFVNRCGQSSRGGTLWRNLAEVDAESLVNRRGRSTCLASGRTWRSSTRSSASAPACRVRPPRPPIRSS